MIRRQHVSIILLFLLGFFLLSTSLIYAADTGEPDALGFESSDIAALEKDFEDQSSNVFDPLSGYNRIMTTVNDKIYFWFLKPVAQGYNYVVPEIVRTSIDRCFTNVLFPVRFVNNLLQLKFKRAGIEISRFVVNTTVGIGGLTDPAMAWFDLHPYDEDLGQTLGYYGLGGGFPIVWPVFGPSNVRDTVGMVGDFFLDPINYIDNMYISTGIQTYKRLNHTSLHIGEYESIKKDSVDLYILLRDAYEQKRNRDIEE